MAERGYSLVSSRESHGVTFEFWTEEASARKARSLEELVPVDLEKRDINIEGRHCETACAFQTNVPKANTTECKTAYNELYGTYGRFTLPAGQALSAKTSSCSIWIVNHSSDSITYDYWDAAGTGQWLNGHCLQEQGATVGVCQYTGIGTNVTNGVWTAVCHPTFMTGNPS
ncbi:hypothetical protein CPB86DRAFT_784507 [Serendipita vermifera]|nr:hypothetical protein CPB86DRAFT_784507 [Serendipita vermifera]